MLKFIFKFIRTFSIGLIWSYLYLLISNTILIYFWNFNVLSSNSWKLVKSFWERGGTIHTGIDYMLLSLLILLIPLWIWGWKRLCKFSYLNILFWPIQAYNNHIIRKYGGSSSRIILRNMGRSKKITEEIEQMSTPAQQIKTDVEVNKIRNAISEKINSVKHT